MYILSSCKSTDCPCSVFGQTNTDVIILAICLSSSVGPGQLPRLPEARSSSLIIDSVKTQLIAQSSTQVHRPSTPLKHGTVKKQNRFKVRHIELCHKWQTWSTSKHEHAERMSAISRVGGSMCRPFCTLGDFGPTRRCLVSRRCFQGRLYLTAHVNPKAKLSAEHR